MRRIEDGFQDFGYWWFRGESCHLWYREEDGALLAYVLYSPSPLLLGRFQSPEAAWAHLGWGRGRRVVEVYFPRLGLRKLAS